MNPSRLDIISGVAPGASGTGWLLRGLIREIESAELPIRLLHRADKRSVRGLGALLPKNLLARVAYFWSKATFSAKAMSLARDKAPVLLLHPQTLGHPLFSQVVTKRGRAWMYVLDNYFFCLAGYNHISEETAPCLRCLASRGEPALAHGCRDAFSAGPFVPSLRDWVESGRLGLIAQCRTQANLLRCHFGPATRVKVVPLHVPDIAVVQRKEIPARPRPLAVFHGSTHPAKGIGLAVALAKEMRDWDFIIPANPGEARHLPALHGVPTPNVLFRPMTWEAGLAEAVAEADAVLCPSLWSAPVEGALLKSLAATGVVLAYPHETSFASELPQGSFIPLRPNRIAEAAEELRAIHRDPAARIRLRDAAAKFVTAYAGQTRNMASALLAACD